MTSLMRGSLLRLRGYIPELGYLLKITLPPLVSVFLSKALSVHARRYYILGPYPKGPKDPIIRYLGLVSDSS